MRWKFWTTPESDADDVLELAAMRKRLEIDATRQRILRLAANDAFHRNRGYGRARPWS